MHDYHQEQAERIDDLERALAVARDKLDDCNRAAVDGLKESDV